jgi:hypothetical protein
MGLIRASKSICSLMGRRSLGGPRGRLPVEDGAQARAKFGKKKSAIFFPANFGVTLKQFRNSLQALQRVTLKIIRKARIKLFKLY